MSAASIPHSPAASTARLVENTDVSTPSQPGRRAPGPIPTQNPKCGLIVIDFDTADGYPPWAAEFPELDEAPGETTRKGVHTYFLR